MRLSYLLIITIGVISLFFVGCEDSGTEPLNANTDTDTSYVIPTYADDYSSISSWSDRNQWNLANVHDPSVAYYKGYYYMYCTDASYGNEHVGHGHFQGKRSSDLVNWNWVGGPFYDAPSWIADSLNAIRSRMGLDAIAEDDIQYGYWAPVVRKIHQGGQEKLRMYYSIIIDNYIKTGNPTSSSFDGSWTERAFIGMCETTDPDGAVWTDKGFVTCSTSDRGLNFTRTSTNDWSGYFKYNAIDPSFIITPEGEHWLIYGSWHSGITAMQLDADTGLPMNEIDINDESTWGTHIYTRSNGSRWQASEGPEVIYNEETGFYYMFLAYDELSVAYNTRVCRASNLSGPYYSFNGANITNGGEVYPILTHPYAFDNHSGWVGISHCCVFQNEETGDWFYSSQGRLPANINGNVYSNAIMMGHIRKIRWTDDGWPVVMPERYTAVPKKEISEDELLGTWEHITLNYEHQKQQTSVALTLSSDHLASGALTGSWSFDASNNILTIGSTNLYVERELDWEASPRAISIVFSGLNPSGVSIWGKKKN